MCIFLLKSYKQSAPDFRPTQRISRTKRQRVHSAEKPLCKKKEMRWLRYTNSGPPRGRGFLVIGCFSCRLFAITAASGRHVRVSVLS